MLLEGRLLSEMLITLIAIFHIIRYALSQAGAGEAGWAGDASEQEIDRESAGHLPLERPVALVSPQVLLQSLLAVKDLVAAFLIAIEEHLCGNI